MPNQKNINAVKALTDKIKSAKSLIFADYKGLDANQANELRKQLSETGSELEIAKNTLIKISLKEAGTNISDHEKTFEGPTALILSKEDAISTIKKLCEFVKKSTLPKVKLSILDGKFFSGPEIETISKLPSREELIAQIVGRMKSPIYGIVNVLSGTKRNLVYVLSEVAKSKS